MKALKRRDDRHLERAQAAWEEERSFIEARIAEGPVPRGRTCTREELYEERLSRYGRDDD